MYVVIFDGFEDNLAKKTNDNSLVHYSLSNVRGHFPPNTFSYFEGFEYNLISGYSIGQHYRSQNNGLKPTDHSYA